MPGNHHAVNVLLYHTGHNAIIGTVDQLNTLLRAADHRIVEINRHLVAVHKHQARFTGLDGDVFQVQAAAVGVHHDAPVEILKDQIADRHTGKGPGGQQ